MGRLLVCGSLAYDYILAYPGHLQESLAPLKVRDRCNITLQASKLDRHPGGCGGNISYTLALLGENPRLLSIAGGDFSSYQRHLEKVGVDLGHVIIMEHELSASCVILTDSVHNRVVAFYGGATDHAGGLDFDEAADVEISGCLIAPDDSLAMVRFADAARRLQLPFIFDIGSQVSGLNPGEIRASVVGAEVLLCNDYEMSILQSKTGWDLDRLLQEVGLVTMTRGEHGSVLYQAQHPPLEIPAVPLRSRAVDSTGAGDGYRAGFCYGWTRQLSWEQCGRLASTAAAFVLEAPGTQGHFFSLDDYWARYRENFGELDLDQRASKKSAHS